MSKPVDIGSRRELFVDHLLVDHLKGAAFQQHEPQLRNVAFKHNKLWEGPSCIYGTVIQDGDRVLYYYRGSGFNSRNDAVLNDAVYCVAESTDGIHFKRLDLGLCAVKDGKKNNIIIDKGDVTHTFAPFLNTRPGAPKGQRFLAFGRGKATNVNTMFKRALFAYASADGIQWRLLSKQPIITDGAFDSQNVGFWSAAEGTYVAYYRTFTQAEKTDFLARKGPTVSSETHGLRIIKRAVSDDFLHWEPGVVMDYRTAGKPAPVEEFYINQTHPYFRAPHIYTALPARFMALRPALTEDQAKATGANKSQLNACSDACFMTARPGNTWYDRTFMEALIKPRIGDKHWTARCNYPANGIIQTGETEMSIYVDEFYAQKENQLSRYSLRLDGFSSIRAPHAGGELLTKPICFSGDELELNYATSAAGSMRVEIRDDKNKPIPGYCLRDAADIFGNRINGKAKWSHGTTVSKLAGKPVRLRFVMRDADLFAFRFV